MLNAGPWPDDLLVDGAREGDHPDVGASEIRAAFGDVFDQATLFHGVRLHVPDFGQTRQREREGLLA